jgi:hypothetical protein
VLCRDGIKRDVGVSGIMKTDRLLLSRESEFSARVCQEQRDTVPGYCNFPRL